MNFIQTHILSIIEQYSYPQALSEFLKQYFSEHKKLGSRDRKALREAVYLYYRWQPFLTCDSPLVIIKWCIDQKLTSIPYLIKMMEEIQASPVTTSQPSWPELSLGMLPEHYNNNLQSLPDLFIRINHKKKFDILKKLKNLTDQVKLVDTQGHDVTIIRLPNGCPIQDVLTEEDYLVQDYASQLCLLKSAHLIERKISTLWDVCSGAGGKTILAHQLFQPTLTQCFDIRPQILLNLRKRVDKLRLNNIKTHQHDWSKSAFNDTKGNSPQLIICDVPCTGSGTWGRTPENMIHFKQDILDEVTLTQSQIMKHVLSMAQSGTYILYITCSVFQAENESQIRAITENYNVEILQEALIDGSIYLSDSMYYCLMQVK